EETVGRIGRWVDFKGAWKTMDKEFMESVWWAFQKLYNEGKIYEGEKVLLYCIRDATPISKAEVAMDNSYQDDTDPSAYVKFKLVDSDSYLLAWTTMAWTLLATTGLAVDQKADYVEVLVGDEKFILAKDTVEKVLTDERHQPIAFTVLREFKGKELVGQAYEPIFRNWGKKAHKVHHADFVTTEEGTGVVTQAPAYGEDDYALARQADFPVAHVIDDSGIITEESEWKGQQLWEANKPIAKRLHEQGIVWKIEFYRHSYPHCHRCGTKLIYRAHPSWFMDIEGQREQMLEQNGNVNWFPEHIKQGRFAKTVQSAPDWNLSRDRFWATAMPVWKGVDKQGKEHIKVVGSYAELKELSGVELEDYHRPWVDDVTFTIDDVEYKRIDKVLDCWFESGSVPFARFHYPFENTDKFEQNFPGDFISEYVGQVRAWFYYLHTVSVGLFGVNSFKNVIVSGTLAGNDGRKMSKSYGNYTDPNELMDKYSADSLRFLLLNSPVLNAEDFALQDKDVADVARKLAMIWNMYDFFTLYADVDGWDSGLAEGELPTDPLAACHSGLDPESSQHKSAAGTSFSLDPRIHEDDKSGSPNPLDEWIVSRVHQLSQEVDAHMQRYDVPNALKPILPFIDDASNWYVRRSRKRFWKPWDTHRSASASGTAARSGDTAGTGDNFSTALLTRGTERTAPSAAPGENPSSTQLYVPEVGDKDAAYRTLHYVLVQLSLILAPFTPFLSEELYRNLTGGESVHLLDWPESGHINELLLNEMETTRMVVRNGLGSRAAQGLKIRQPLKLLRYSSISPIRPEFEEIIAEETNVKSVCYDKNFPMVNIQLDGEEPSEPQAGISAWVDPDITPELKQEGLAREIIRHVQQARKQAGLDVDDRIKLALQTDDKALQAVLDDKTLMHTIQTETLATGLSEAEKSSFSVTVSVGDVTLTIKIDKNS
ncbi:MAG: class I tRNA ligase family protein, partial [Candidatus Saccharimonadales bacterium]